MPVLAHHDTITGPLTAADLDAARRNNPGSIWQISPHRMLPGRDTCNGSCETAPGCDCIQPMPAEACTEVGHSAAESMFRHRRNRATVGLALMLAIAGAAVHFIWPLAV